MVEKNRSRQPGSKGISQEGARTSIYPLKECPHPCLVAPQSLCPESMASPLLSPGIYHGKACFHPHPAAFQDLSWEVMASPLPNCLSGFILWKHGFIPAQLSPRICHEKAWPHLCPVVSKDLSPEGMVSLLPRCLPGFLFQQWVTFLIMGEPSHSLWKDPSRHRPFINLQVY